jgi:hypothetical protein
MNGGYCLPKACNFCRKTILSNAQRQMLLLTETRKGQAGKPGRQTPTVRVASPLGEGDPPAALALQRTGSPTDMFYLFIYLFMSIYFCTRVSFVMTVK